jgi:hypothetical protein
MPYNDGWEPPAGGAADVDLRRLISQLLQRVAVIESGRLHGSGAAPSDDLHQDQVVATGAAGSGGIETSGAGAAAATAGGANGLVCPPSYEQLAEQHAALLQAQEVLALQLQEAQDDVFRVREEMADMREDVARVQDGTAKIMLEYRAAWERVGIDENSGFVASIADLEAVALELEGRMTVRAAQGWLSALRVLLCKSVLYGAFVWARRALKHQKRRFLARAE